MNRVQV